jgi:hypothetical protein
MEIMPGISHPYGYKTRYEMKRGYSFDMADRTETPLELDDTTCGDDMPCAMMQIFSLKLARAPTGGGPAVQLYGYLAARDEIDYKLVHVFNRGREDPITVRRGSLIEMTGPKRPIAVMCCDVLLEFDMRIKNGDNEDDDVRLIDGASFFHGLHMPYRPRKVRLDSACGGAVDMSFAHVDYAVGAMVDVVVAEVHTVRHV